MFLAKKISDSYYRYQSLSFGAVVLHIFSVQPLQSSACCLLVQESVNEVEVVDDTTAKTLTEETDVVALTPTGDSSRQLADKPLPAADPSTSKPQTPPLNGGSEQTGGQFPFTLTTQHCGFLLKL